MPEIHPNDIGLATYDEVGDVAKLKTAAKTIVSAINEIYQNGGTKSDTFGEQLYVDGEDNVIIGENNIVYGSGNLIIGSNNCIAANNLTVIADKITKYKSNDGDYYYDWFDTSENKLWFYYYDEENIEFPFKVGDKVVLSVCKQWTTENWDDWVSLSTGLCIAEIIEIDEESWYVKFDGISLSSEPPDDIHIIEDYTYTECFIPLNEAHLLQATNGALSFGGTPNGTKSAAFGVSTAEGSYSFSVGSSKTKGNYSTALCMGDALSYAGFAANDGYCYGEKGTALNYAYAYTPYSFSHGYYGRVLGRPLKATSLNATNRYIVIDSEYSLSGIATGSKLIIRCFNCLNTIIFSEQTVKSVSGNTIYLEGEGSLGGNGNYAYQLFPDGIIFTIDTSTSYSNASEAGGYYTIATGKYTNANGYHTIAGAEGSNIWGKYGTITEPYSLALGNGTGHKAHGLAFKVLSDGSVHADAEYTTPCADYAEYFEWLDGNPDAEDRVGYFVKLEGEKIVKCGEFDKPLGIVSAMPAIIGDSGEMHWKGKFRTDDFGRIQYHDVVIPAEYDDELNLISEEHIERQPIINPDWDSSEEYIPRKERPEWSPIGVLGKLVVFDDGTLKSGDICRPGANGIAVKSVENGYPVLKRVAEDKVLIWFKE